MWWCVDTWQGGVMFQRLMHFGGFRILVDLFVPGMIQKKSEKTWCLLQNWFYSSSLTLRLTSKQFYAIHHSIRHCVMVHTWSVWLKLQFCEFYAQILQLSAATDCFEIVFVVIYIRYICLIWRHCAVRRSFLFTFFGCRKFYDWKFVIITVIT